MFYLRDLPKYEAICQRCQRYPEVDPASVETSLVLLRVASDMLTALEGYWAPRRAIFSRPFPGKTRPSTKRRS